MIGQEHLIRTINNYEFFPRFSIITGAKGSGKKTICKYIANKLKASIVPVGTGIDDVRKAIDTALTQYDNILYVVGDADNMSLAAKNSLLKITEEPPKNSYFIMTLVSLENTLSTIQSRATTFSLDPYTKEELVEYRKFRGYSDSFDTVVKDLCSSTGQVDELFSYDVKDFYDFCNVVANNIHVPRNGNTFKLTQKLKIKETDKGFDVMLFLQAVQSLFLKIGMQQLNKHYIKACIQTSKSLQELKSSAVNKLGVLDMWIINVRKELLS